MRPAPVLKPSTTQHHQEVQCEAHPFEIPRGIHAADGVSHHYPFAFSLPVDFYDVGLHSVIVGDEDSDVAHVPFIVQMVTLDEH